MPFSIRTVRGALALAVATVLVAPMALAAPVTETLGDGRGAIDWTHGTLTVTGSGAPPDRGSLAQKRLLARRAAVVDGYRQLAELISGVRVDSETVVKDFTLESDSVRTQVDALVKGAQPSEPRYLSDGSVEVDLTVPFYGATSLFSAVDFNHKIAKPIPQPSADNEPATGAAPRPDEPAPTPAATPSAAAAAPEPSPSPSPAATPAAPDADGQPGTVPAPPRPDAAAAPADGRYTGLIVDCREANIQPAMSPTILDPGGKELYVGKLPIDPDQVIAVGIVGYAESLDEATANADRVGAHPLVVHAKASHGQYKADVTLSTTDSQALLNADADGHFLAHSRVLFVVRP